MVSSSFFHVKWINWWQKLILHWSLNLQFHNCPKRSFFFGARDTNLLSLYADVSDSDSYEHLCLHCTSTLWSSGGQSCRGHLRASVFSRNKQTRVISLASHQERVELKVYLFSGLCGIVAHHSHREGNEWVNCIHTLPERGCYTDRGSRMAK